MQIYSNQIIQIFYVINQVYVKGPQKEAYRTRWGKQHTNFHFYRRIQPEKKILSQFDLLESS